MRVSRTLLPELPAAVASRLIYSPLGNSYEMSKESTTQFTVILHTAGNFIISDLATKSI
jgi:hypothetical protein